MKVLLCLGKPVQLTMRSNQQRNTHDTHYTIKAVYSLVLCVPPMRQDKILEIDYIYMNSNKIQ